MIDSFNVAATGLFAQQLGVDTIANNLANVNSTGFKRSRVHFEDVFYRQLLTSSNQLLAAGNDKLVGGGTGIASIERIFAQGELRGTERELDVAIQGDGFFEVVMPDGEFAYTRSGTFSVDDTGTVITNEGFVLNPALDVPRDASAIIIRPDGSILAEIAGATGQVPLGRFELARFTDTGALTPIGNNLFVPSTDSSRPLFGVPGEDGFGLLAQGFLETSNVDLVDELTNLILAQRAYELSARVVQVSDEILGIVNELPR